jgi:hypothetical protein
LGCCGVCHHTYLQQQQQMWWQLKGLAQSDRQQQAAAMS